MLTADTKHRIDACRDILVGKLPQPYNQVELIYKFMDDLDEDSVLMGGPELLRALLAYVTKAVPLQELVCVA